jgi:hypothetical protein
MLEIENFLREHSTMLYLLELVETFVECFVEVVQMLFESKEFSLLYKFDSNIVTELVEYQFPEYPQLLGPFVPENLTQLIKLVSFHR